MLDQILSSSCSGSMPPRLALSVFCRSALSRETCQCSCRNAARRGTLEKQPAFTTSSRRKDVIGRELDERPRWQQTPKAMVAPVRLKTFKPDNEYPVNEDPRRLDQVYVQVLGQGGYKMLTEEVKWLAVTHKSFDQGRRGYNDRLAFLGRIHSQMSAWSGVANLNIFRQKDSRSTDFAGGVKYAIKSRSIRTTT